MDDTLKLQKHSNEIPKLKNLLMQHTNQQLL